jgi:hypothetical protein
MRTLLVLIYLLVTGISLAQSKKEQIEELNMKVDSINFVLNSERKANSELIQTLKTTIDKLDVQLTSLKNEYQRKIDDLDVKTVNYRKIIDSLHYVISQKSDSLKFQEKIIHESKKIPGITEYYQNCIPKHKYKKRECSDLSLLYPDINAFSANPEKEEMIQSIIKQLFFGLESNLSFDELKDKLTTDFQNDSDEYYERETIGVFCEFYNSDIMSLQTFKSLYSEDAPCEYIGEVESFIYDFVSNERIGFDKIFKPDAKKMITKLIHDQLLDEDISLENLVPEDMNLEEIISFDGVIISEERNGFCFFVGQFYDCLLPLHLCISFDDCKNLINPEFYKKIY